MVSKLIKHGGKALYRVFASKMLVDSIKIYLTLLQEHKLRATYVPSTREPEKIAIQRASDEVKSAEDDMSEQHL